MNRSSEEGIWSQFEDIKKRTVHSFPLLQTLINPTIKMQLTATIRELSSEILTSDFWEQLPSFTLKYLNKGYWR